MSFNLRSIFTIYITLFWLVQASFAQDNECIDFDDGIESGVYGQASNYMPGTTLFTDDGVVISLDSFLYFNGTKDLLNVTFTDDPLFGGNSGALLDDDYVFISNVNMVFDFDNLPENTTQVCFNFLDGGGQENIAVNGQPIRTLQNLLEIDGQEIAPGVTASVQLSNAFDFPAGTLCLNGKIETLLIGGQEFAMDELCFYTEGVNDDDDDDDDNGGDDTCEYITDLTIDVGDCNDNGTFDLKINFNVQTSNAANYTVKYSGETYGPFDISQRPLVLPLPADDSPHTEDIKICLGNTTDGCCAEVRFMQPDCNNSDNDNCALSNLRLEDLECISNTEYRVTINFDRRNPDAASFVLRTAGGFEETYSYDALPLRIALPKPSQGRFDEIKVIDKENPDCYTRIEFELPCENNPCELAQGTAEDIECISDGRYRVTLNFRHNGREGSFQLKSRGGFEETYSYSDLPLRIALPLTSEGFDEVKIQDKDDPDCYTFIEYRIPCDQPCRLGEIRLRNLECSASGEYHVTVDFEHNREGIFILRTRSGLEQRFNYADLPVRITSRLTNVGLDEIKIQDAEDAECIVSKEFELDCGNSDCVIRNLTATPVDCSEGKFWLKINFASANTGGSGYFIFVDGQLFGPYRYEQTERVVGPFTADNSTIYDILLLDIDSPSCYAYTEVTARDCDDDDDDDCNEISNIRVQTGNCANDGTFELSINFATTTNANNSFAVFFRGDVLGTFELSQLPITIAGLRGDDEPHMEDIKICLRDGNGDDRCCEEVSFMLPDCQSQTECAISNVRAEVSECNADGKFFVKLRFEHENTGRGFKVFGNGENYGEFSYQDAFVELGPFHGDGETRYEFAIQDLDNENCQSVIELEPVACTVEVWPGDANANNRADHFDLLNIGIAFGAEGPARATPSIAWQGFNSLLWNQAFDNGTNFAHADANGDGKVDFADKEAIAQNYGLVNSNNIEPVPQLPGTDIDPPIFVDLPNNGNLPSGLAFSVPVVLGTSDNFIEDLYGIAFTIDFDPTIIDPASIEISYPKSWMGEENTNLITFDRVDQQSGQIHIAITRIDQTNASGFGSVALVSGIIDDIAGRVVGGDIEITNVYAINTLHRRIPLQTWKQRIQIKSQDEVPGRIDLKRNVRIIPNPTSDLIQVYTPYSTPVESIQLLDAQGKPVRQPVQNTDTISLGDVPQGIYMLRIKIGEHIIHERVVKM